jgi:hypothetical protein
VVPSEKDANYPVYRLRAPATTWAMRAATKPYGLAGAVSSQPLPGPQTSHAGDSMVRAREAAAFIDTPETPVLA